MLPSERHVWSPKHLGQQVKEPRIDVDFLAKHLSSVFWRVRKPLQQTKRKHQRNLFSQCEWSTQPVFFLQGDLMIRFLKNFALYNVFSLSIPNLVWYVIFFPKRGGRFQDSANQKVSLLLSSSVGCMPILSSGRLSKKSKHESFPYEMGVQIFGAISILQFFLTLHSLIATQHHWNHPLGWVGEFPRRSGVRWWTRTRMKSLSSWIEMSRSNMIFWGGNSIKVEMNGGKWLLDLRALKGSRLEQRKKPKVSRSKHILAVCSCLFVNRVL